MTFNEIFKISMSINYKTDRKKYNELDHKQVNKVYC